MHGMAVAHAQSDHFDKATKIIEQAIEKDSSNPALYNTLGNLYFRQNKLEPAKKAYEAAYELAPNFVSACNNLANIHMVWNEFEIAEKYYQIAIRLNENFPDTHYNYATLLARQNKMDQAIEELQETLRIMPKHARALGQLGHIYLGKEDYPKAVDYFQRSLHIRQDYINIHFGLGQAFFKLQKFEKAITAFQEVLNLNEKYLNVNYFIATAHLYLNQRKEALQYYLRQLEIEPDAQSYYNVGVILMDQERHKEAIDYFNQAIHANPNAAENYINLGAIYLKMNQVQQALTCYEKALTLRPDDQEIQHIVAALSSGKEKPAAAPKEYLKRLFNQYAPYYDKHLNECLAYKIPQEILNTLQKETDLNQTKKLNILDLGCGTGLCGQLLKPYAKHLIGVDLAEKMLETAKEKNTYDELVCEDIHTVMEKYSNFNLIVAADVFTYVGNLSVIFEKAYAALAPHGLFIFTVEKTSSYPYTLQPTIRYAHNKKYLEELMERYHFSLVKCDNIILRKQQKLSVEGYLVLLKK